MPSLARSVLKDGQDVTVERYDATADWGGHEAHEFAAPTTERVLIRPAEAVPFKLAELGDPDATEWWAVVADADDIGVDDRVHFDPDGAGDQPYRLVEPESCPVNGLTLYQMQRDNRAPGGGS